MDDQRIDVLTATYSDFTGHSVNFGKLVREKKRAIVESTFSDAHQQLAGTALMIARNDWRWRDLSPRQLREALARLITALPIYRTYRTSQSLHEEDKRILVEAAAKRAHRRPRISTGLRLIFWARCSRSRRSTMPRQILSPSGSS